MTHDELREELQAFQKEGLHTPDPLDPEDRAAMDSLLAASDRGIGSITFFAPNPGHSENRSTT